MLCPVQCQYILISEILLANSDSGVGRKQKEGKKSFRKNDKQMLYIEDKTSLEAKVFIKKPQKNIKELEPISFGEYE